MNYNPASWYWAVAESTTQVYSSAAAAYVSVTDATYVAWLSSGNGPTPIASEALLEGVFAAQYPAGWPAVAVKVAAQTALDSADLTMLRIVEAVALGANSWTNADVVAWVNYRHALRAVVQGSSTTLPFKPAYPAGT